MPDTRGRTTRERRPLMLLRTADPFRDFDRLTQQVLGTTNRPAVMAMDAWREGDTFVIEFDLPGVARDSVDLDVERNVLTVRAERLGANGDWEMLAAERPRGMYSRQLVLGTTWTSIGSRPPTRTGCSGSRFRSRSERSRARSPSPSVRTRIAPPSRRDPAPPEQEVVAVPSPDRGGRAMTATPHERVVRIRVVTPQEVVATGITRLLEGRHNGRTITSVAQRRRTRHRVLRRDRPA